MAVTVEIEVDLPADVGAALAAVVRTTAAKTVEMHGAGDPEIAVLIADAGRLHGLNRKFREVDRPTDVLAFPNDNGGGDVAMAVDIATAHAEEAGWSREREVAYLTAHAVLHLLGHDHDDDAAYRKMRGAEEQVLEALGYRRTEEY
jgi:probable rRNA maturation factor